MSVPTSEEASERRELRSWAEVPAARKAKVVRRAVKRILVVLVCQMGRFWEKVLWTKVGARSGLVVVVGMKRKLAGK